MSAGTAILIVFGVLFLIVIILIIWAIAIYNGLVGKRELVNEGWSSIDVQLKPCDMLCSFQQFSSIPAVDHHRFLSC